MWRRLRRQAMPLPARRPWAVPARPAPNAGTPAKTVTTAARSDPKPKVLPKNGAAQSTFSVVVYLRVDGNVAGRVNVLDASGRRLPAKAHISLIRGGKTVSAVDTNERGQFQVHGLQPGVYSVIASGPDGFAVLAVQVLPYTEDAPREKMLLDLTLVPSDDADALSKLLAQTDPPEPADPPVTQGQPMSGGGGGGGVAADWRSPALPWGPSAWALESAPSANNRPVRPRLSPGIERLGKEARAMNDLRGAAAHHQHPLVRHGSCVQGAVWSNRPSAGRGQYPDGGSPGTIDSTGDARGRAMALRRRAARKRGSPRGSGCSGLSVTEPAPPRCPSACGPDGRAPTPLGIGPRRGSTHPA